MTIFTIVGTFLGVMFILSVCSGDERAHYE